MTDLVVAAVSILIALLVLMLRKAYFNLPLYELKRRANRGDQFARAIYPAAVFPAFRGLLWLVMALFSSLAVILLNRQVPLFLGLVVAVLWIWLAFSWIPNRQASKFSEKLASHLTPLFVWLLNLIYPALKQLEKLQSRYQVGHTRVYESEDLRQFVHRQGRQEDNRISPVQLERLTKLVAYEESKVSKYARPWQKSLKLYSEEPIGPKLLDEMHRSEQTAFAVTQSKNGRQVVGILSKEAVGLHSEGRVGDYMLKKVETIQEDELVENALNLFANSSLPLIIVVDQEGDISGTLTLKDALSALMVVDTSLEEAAEEEAKQDAENTEEVIVQ